MKVKIIIILLLFVGCSSYKEMYSDGSTKIYKEKFFGCTYFEAVYIKQEAKQ